MTSTIPQNAVEQPGPIPEDSLPFFLGLEHVLKTSGMCVDSPLVLRWIMRGGSLQTLALRFLRLKFTPMLLGRIRGLSAELSTRSALFTQAISYINARETYKTTGLDRTRLADAAVLRGIQGVPAPRLLEVGVSDGVSCIRLLESLPADAVAELTDRHPYFYRKGLPFACLLADADGRLLGLKLPLFYLNLPLSVTFDTASWARIETINPILPESLGINVIRPFDVRWGRATAPVHAIKCANVFNRHYFPDQVIRAATANLGESLLEGGILVISQNNARYPGGEAYFVLRKTGGRLVLEEKQGGHEALELFQADGESRA
ncbi:MAG: hypothetical protein CVU73_06485 [Deltaproteobacteria bacterium HGW-Deltaproteobacteria-8]|jgi:hypothetical protein|nr:MAG: hypothetical protein CVU73_06485 [Deltaproteobacteria bacterium HGW-Deltaproteobacteria-8]